MTIPLIVASACGGLFVLAALVGELIKNSMNDNTEHQRFANGVQRFLMAMSAVGVAGGVGAHFYIDAAASALGYPLHPYSAIALGVCGFVATTSLSGHLIVHLARDRFASPQHKADLHWAFNWAFVLSIVVSLVTVGIDYFVI